MYTFIFIVLAFLGFAISGVENDTAKTQTRAMEDVEMQKNPPCGATDSCD